MGHIGIHSVNMHLDIRSVESNAVHIAGANHQSGVHNLCIGLAVADCVEFHVQVVVADVSEQQDRIDVLGSPVGQGQSSAAQSVPAVHHRMGDTLIGDGGSSILVRQLGHRSDGAGCQILE